MSSPSIPAPQHLCSLLPLRRALLCVCGAWYLLSGASIAVSQDSAKKVAAKPDSAKKAPAAADSTKPLTADQLDALVAPIALYPDELLGQTLVASTYPLEIVQLQQWLAKNPKLKDKALADSVAKQPWDPSIQSMAAIPDLVKRLSEDIQWTTQLGNAFLADQSAVMAAVQRMRKKAKDKGTLETNEQQKVETKVVEKTEVIVVQSQNPEVVYVPSYSPTVVYGPPVYAYPPIYYPPYHAGAAFVSFGVGMMWGAAMWGGSCCHSHWGGGGNNIYINNNNNFNRVNHNNVGRGGAGNRNWSHNPQHRGGAPYADARSNSKYGSQNQRAGQNQRGGGAGASDRAAGTGQGQRGGAGGAGVSDRAAAGGGGQGQRSASAGDRSAGGGAGGSNRSTGSAGGAGGGGLSGGGGGSIGSTSRSSGGGYSGGGGFGGGSSGYSGSNARASSSRGSSSMGSRGGYGGGSRGGGGRRR